MFPYLPTLLDLSEGANCNFLTQIGYKKGGRDGVVFTGETPHGS